MMIDFTEILVQPSCSVGHTMEIIDRAGSGIALVVDDSGRLVDTVTDGDIRRSLLSNATLDSPVQVVTEEKEARGMEGPVTVREGASNATLSETFGKGDIDHLPVVDEEGRVKALLTKADVVPTHLSMDIRGVVMAGGFGTRLRPFTEETPKPMLPVGGQPLIAHLVTQLAEAGIDSVTITTHYRAEQIRNHFGDGSDFGVDIDYLHEEEPLGTAGFLEHLRPWERDLLVVNGDVMTDADFREMVRFHRDQDADVTVAVREHETEIPYGTLEMDGFHITGLREKPSFSFFINAGIYVLSPTVSDLPSESEMTNLVKAAMRENFDVLAYPLEARWIDIGEPEEYERARNTFDDFDL